MEREPNTQYILSLSYGKDSLACLQCIEDLGLPLDRIVHAEVWATQDIPADLPPMMEFKAKADAIIKARWGIEVEHVCATKKCSQNGNVERERLTYEDIFYRKYKHTSQKLHYTTANNDKHGYPQRGKLWCQSRLKASAIDKAKSGLHSIHVEREREREQIPGFQRYGNRCGATGELKLSPLRIPNLDRTGQLVYPTQTEVFSPAALSRGGKQNIVQYLGIAADEPERIKRHDVKGKMMPLVMAGWTESMARKWCEENDLLSPIYTTATRGGCWFCHNQGVDQLRLLRKNYPDLWQLLLKWDSDSPVTFHADGHTVHDFDKRFEYEERGIITADETFRWWMLDREYHQTTLFSEVDE